jgi:hypothetical protein
MAASSSLEAVNNGYFSMKNEDPIIKLLAMILAAIATVAIMYWFSGPSN